MSIRTNEVNNGGLVTVAGGNMPANNFTAPFQPISRTGNGNVLAAITTNVGSHTVEVGGDYGLWDTVSGAKVSRDATNIDVIGT